MVKKGVLLFVLLALIMFFSGCTTEPDGPKFFGTWLCNSLTFDSLSMTDCVITLNGNASFSLSYQSGGANTQTGTFAPTDLPENTTITFTVVTSSSPAVPPPASTWFLRYTNLTADTVDIELDLTNDGYDDSPVSFTTQ